MKNIAIISLSVLFLSACAATSTSKTVVGTTSHTEVYETETVLEPVLIPTDTNIDINDANQAINDTQSNVTQSVQNATSQAEEAITTSQSNMGIAGVCDNQEMIMADKEDLKSFPSFNSYLIQVISVQETNKVIGIEEYAKKLPSTYSKWKHKKQISGQEWSTLLIGEFESSQEARAALTALSNELTTFSPFVVSTKSIQCSGNPSLTKL